MRAGSFNTKLPVVFTVTTRVRPGAFADPTDLAGALHGYLYVFDSYLLAPRKPLPLSLGDQSSMGHLFQSFLRRGIIPLHLMPVEAHDWPNRIAMPGMTFLREETLQSALLVFPGS